MGYLGAPINITVITQVNTNVGINLALFSPGAVQTLVQQGSNAALAAQGRK
jgi:hypothetical protein